MDARIYVGTYAKYNAGSLFGEWLDLADYSDKDEFIEACLELHADEEDPELMFQDWEGIPANMVSECDVDSDLWEVMEAAEEFDEKAVFAYLSIFHQWDADDFRDRYRGEYSSWEAMAEELLEETGELSSIPERLRYYFDYEKYANDLRLSGDLVEEDGHFFWNH